ncbi:type II toxin-antitoxin system VapC family toxin [Leptolyngbyaceae cyanobacterium CCMR0082]|uniref:Type II toxin-antitoxin system VapC family toxin n=1 Tax=Adonisia turfae CCMR0082 TaxID=2304604 RepID=A0A6M0S9D3_9CYAN|nr:type II toxin-antitoxin system VapC family toxin [Adonisia turfae]NEZ64382.1 type II toxin-antitoxin system VapC family toxin [Adonisia turfae CCMR0082]
MGMSYLLDTHILLWWLFDDPKLNADCRDIIRNPEHRILVSSASAWEIATKYRIGKLPEAKELVENYPQILHKARLIELAITATHALRAGNLPIAHRDPFDRMLMAPAELEQLPIITYDNAFQTGLIQLIPEPESESESEDE